MTFIDDFSRYNSIYLLYEKSQSLDMFKNFKVKIDNQLNKRIKSIRSNCGSEYCRRYDNSSEQRLRSIVKS